MLLKAVLVAVVAVAGYGVYYFDTELAFDVKYYKHYPGVCRRVAGADHGSEDIHVTSDGKAFISTGFQSPQAGLGERQGFHGGVHLFDFKNPSDGAVDLKIVSEKRNLLLMECYDNEG
ncbi:serum paraoxonase/arylesterase 1 [Elysia marginata]|uniref:Serum paraoxonase/arylesterase 1 n=1 Tax=Elysia marginata TaxID=1093978 RepID=A0AAV4JD80_9GAST|nr:serum paraoxonase/arylesterase 1 [Elysia marginata]